MQAQNRSSTVGITGAAGNIGTTLRKGLSGQYRLRLYDIREVRHTDEEEWIKVDSANPKELEGVFNGLDALIHLAGDPRPNAPSESTLRNNFRATSYVFEEARRAGVKKIVFASSNFYHEGSIGTALRGRSKQLITLGMQPTPDCLYGQSKVFGENVGLHLSYLGVQFVALRIGWTVPEDNPRLYGGDYMRAMFCSKRDLVQAFVRAVEVDASFLTAFVISDNGRKVFDLRETKEKLGFSPQDDAERYF